MDELTKGFAQKVLDKLNTIDGRIANVLGLKAIQSRCVTFDANIIPIGGLILIPQWADGFYTLRTPESATIKAGETVDIHLGFALKIPDGWHVRINMFEDAWEVYGICLTNQTKIIRSREQSEWVLSVYRPRSFVDPVHIKAGSLIAMFTLDPDCPQLNFHQDDARMDDDEDKTLLSVETNNAADAEHVLDVVQDRRLQEELKPGQEHAIIRD